MKKILVALLLVACLVLAGCGTAKLGSTNGSQADSSGPGTVVRTAKDNASIVACRTNRALIEQQYTVAQAESPDGSVDFATLIQQMKVKCPSGGSYSWDESAKKSKCSLHGE